MRSSSICLSSEGVEAKEGEVEDERFLRFLLEVLFLAPRPVSLLAADEDVADEDADEEEEKANDDDAEEDEE